MAQRPSVDDFIGWMALTLSDDDPARVGIESAFDAAQELLESRAKDGVLPLDPSSSDYSARMRNATFLQANRYYKRKSSPEGAAGFGDLGVVRISSIDPDIVQMLQGLLRMDGFA